MSILPFYFWILIISVDNRWIWARFATPPSASSARRPIEFKSLSNTFTRRDPRSHPRHIPHLDFDFEDAEADRRYGPIEAVGGGTMENHRKELKELMSEHEHVRAEVRRLGTVFILAAVGSGVGALQVGEVGRFD